MPTVLLMMRAVLIAVVLAACATNSDEPCTDNPPCDESACEAGELDCPDGTELCWCEVEAGEACGRGWCRP